jgi:dCTP deaminase
VALISGKELFGLVDAGVITNVKPSQINAASIDITVGSRFLVEECQTLEGVPYVKALDWSKRDQPRMSAVVGEVLLHPGGFALAESQQLFNLPNDIACEYKLKSSMARIGLEHLNAGWCDPGWNGSVLTLELVNMLRRHSILVREGDPIGQMVFFRCKEPVDRSQSYATRGRYNNDTSVQGAKR